MNTFNPRFNTHDLKNLASAAYYGTNQQIYQELSELSELVGIQIISLPNPSVHTSASHRYPEKSLLLPAKQSVAVLSSAVLNFTDTDCAEGRVRAAFHQAFAPYFADGSVDLDLRADAAEILELMAAVGATIRGQVLGVIGAQGGIGTSTTSLWIAREFARRNYSVALIDLDPNSPGIDLIISQVNTPGKRWRDIHGSGAMLANRLTHSLPKWEGVRFLSADSRGGVEPDAGSGENAISALSQVHEWTILDLPTSVLHPASPTHQWLPWCDAILLLSGVDTVSLANTQTRISQLPPETNFAIVAVGANNRGHLADIANQLGCGAIFGLRQQKSLRADREHGLAPGDKPRSSTSRDVRKICAALLEAAEISEANTQI